MYPIQKSVFHPGAVVAKSVSRDQLRFIGSPKKLNVIPIPNEATASSSPKPSEIQGAAFAKKALLPTNERYSKPRMSPFPPNQKMSGFSPLLNTPRNRSAKSPAEVSWKYLRASRFIVRRDRNVPPGE